MSRRRPAAPVPAAVGAFVLGFLAITGLQAGPRAWAYWTDAGTVTSGQVSAWALTNVSCPAPAWGSNHQLSWSQPSGTSTATVALDANSPAPGGLSFWQPAGIQPGEPDTNGSPAVWGIGTSNPLESADFHGTWRLVANAPTVAGASSWTVTRTGTWAVNFDSSVSGTNQCTVNP